MERRPSGDAINHRYPGPQYPGQPSVSEFTTYAFHLDLLPPHVKHFEARGMGQWHLFHATISSMLRAWESDLRSTRLRGSFLVHCATVERSFDKDLLAASGRSIDASQLIA